MRWCLTGKDSARLTWRLAPSHLTREERDGDCLTSSQHSVLFTPPTYVLTYQAKQFSLLINQ